MAIRIDREALRALVERTLKVKVVFERQPAPFQPFTEPVAGSVVGFVPGQVTPVTPAGLAGQASLCTMSIGPVKAIGNDNVFREYNPSTQVQTTTVAGRRTRTVMLRVESFGLTEATELLEEFLTRLNWPSFLDSLHELGLAMVDYGDVRELPLFRDQRAKSYASLELRIASTSQDTDTGNVDSWIEKAEVNGDLIQPDPVADVAPTITVIYPTYLNENT